MPGVLRAHRKGVGLALGPLADYIRGDVKWSYRDNSVQNTNPAIRAERACLFVKAGSTPYLPILDDMHYRNVAHRYDWIWHSPTLPIAGTGTLAEPLVITAETGRCALQFLQPASPSLTITPAKGTGRRARAAQLKRITVSIRATRVRYLAIAPLETDATDHPAVTPQKPTRENPSAGAVTIALKDGHTDRIVWQSEEERVQLGSPLKAGPLATDGLLAWVRLRGQRVVGCLLGEGTYLRFAGKSLVQADGAVSVSAGNGKVEIFGRRRAREGLPAVKLRKVQTLTTNSTN